nr:MAG TPA: hypothetical protein [Caudoviricetes sp.]
MILYKIEYSKTVKLVIRLFCNQWVAGSTPVTSSIQNPWIHLGPGIFLCRTQSPSCAKNDFSVKFVQDATKILSL